MKQKQLQFWRDHLDADDTALYHWMCSVKGLLEIKGL